MSEPTDPFLSYARDDLIAKGVDPDKATEVVNNSYQEEDDT